MGLGLIDALTDGVISAGQGDPAEYDEDGAWFQSLKANCPASKTVRFPDVDHGFTLRAPLHAPGVKVEVERAMGLSLDYLSAQLA